MNKTFAVIRTMKRFYENRFHGSFTRFTNLIVTQRELDRLYGYDKFKILFESDSYDECLRYKNMNITDIIKEDKCYGYRHNLLMQDGTSKEVVSYFRVNNFHHKFEDGILIDVNIITSYEFLYCNYIEREKGSYLRLYNTDEIELWEVSNEAFKEIVKNIYNSYEL